MTEYKREFLQEIIDHYQPYSKEKLTLEDGREIIENLLALAKWAYKTDKAIKLREKMKKEAIEKNEKQKI